MKITTAWRFAFYSRSGLAAMLCVLCSASLAMAQWPQWRGPTRDGQAPAAPVWPRSISEDALILQWQTPLSPSYSGPIVSTDLVFTTETVDEKIERVRALDRQTGEQRWETLWEGAIQVPFFAKANGDWIRATPAYDGESLFVAAMRDVLVCLDAATGAVRWRYDFVAELNTPPPTFGFVCSPLVDGDHVYVQAGAGFCKLEKRTGKLVWRALQDEGGMNGSAFSSPFFAELAGRQQLLVQTREQLAGVDPSSGDVLWSQKVPSFRGMNVLTPTIAAGGVFTSSYGGKTWLYGLTGNGESPALKVNTAWENKVTGYMSSPVVVAGHIYLHLQNQRFTCIDAATGESKWTTRPYGKYWSLIAQGDRILALDERGELLLIRANPEKFELIDSRQISEESTWAHVAVDGEQLFIRELNALAVYRWKDAP